MGRGRAPGFTQAPKDLLISDSVGQRLLSLSG